jgi:pimeloyl-ACP methyl ester carboxylesterase
MYAALYMSERPTRVAQVMLIEPAGLNGDIMQETFGDLFELSLFGESVNQMIWQSNALSPSSHERLDYKSLMLLEGDNTPGYFCNPDEPPDWPIWRPGGYIEIIRGQRLRSGRSFSYDFARGLTAWEAKVLLVGSECSVLGAEFQRTHHADLFGNAEVIEVKGAGHRVLVERPEEILAIARTYLIEYP